MNKYTQIITNRHGLLITVEIYSPEKPRDLVFIQHGISGYKEELHIQKMRDVFYENNYQTIVFDGTNSFGESGGTLEKFTATTHAHDLEDVIDWVSSQVFYQEPFVLAGHSMGGFSVLRYTQLYPEKVKAVAPIASTISGQLLEEAWTIRDSDLQSLWKEKKRIEKTSSQNPPKTGFISWSFMEDFFNYNMLDRAYEIKVPVLLIVGQKDPSTPPSHQKMIFDLLETKKEMHIIQNAPHSFKLPHELAELAGHLDKWIKSI